MPPQNNQIEQNSQVPPMSSGSKKKWLIITLAILLIVFVAGIFYFSKNKSNIVVDIKKDNPIVLNQATKDYYSKYAKDLISELGISSTTDSLNLDNVSKQILQNIKSIISNSSTTVVIDGSAYASLLSLSVQGDSYQFKPIQTSTDSKSFEVIKKETISVDDLIKNREEIEQNIIKILYPKKQKSPDSSNTDIYKSAEKEFNNYLDSQVKAGKLTKYEYNQNTDNLYLTYPYIDIPFQSNPLFLTEQIYYVISAYQNPQIYAENVLKKYNVRLNGGEILIVDTTQIPIQIDFVKKDHLFSDISILTDETLNNEQKISKLSDGQIIINSYDEYKSFKSGNKSTSFFQPKSVYAQDTSFADLMGKDGSVVPPSKNMMYWSGPDFNILGESERLLGNTDIRNLQDSQNGPFSAFLQNDFKFYSIVHTPWNTKSIEDLASILNDNNLSILYWHTHGGEESTMMTEAYDVAPGGFLRSEESFNQYKIKINEFKKRVDELRSKYGSQAIDVYFTYSNLPKDQRDLYMNDSWQIAPKLKYVLDSPKNRMLEIIDITNSFVQEESNNSSKSLVAFHSCYGGTFADAFNTRILLAPKPTSETTSALFNSDLSKLVPYLLKDITKISDNLVTFDNFRNYDVLNSFQQKQFDLNENTPKSLKESLTESCNSQKDTLCSIILYKKNSKQTISASPSVISVTGDKIEFNVPMENSDANKAENVVQIDASQCLKSQADLDKAGKPAWIDDKNITLPWKDKVYRDWKPTDFNGDGSPKVDWIEITVKNDQAVSKISKVNLTGNTDCFGGSAKQTECWQKPDTIKYNGNHPNTDFTFAMPCIEEAYYKTCADKTNIVKISNDNAQQAGFVFPDFIKVSGACYNKFDPTDEERTKAKKITVWEDGKDCIGLCGTPTKGGECLNPLFIEYGEESVPIKKLVDMSGNIIIKEEGGDWKSCKPEIRIIEFASFGTHNSYILKYTYMDSRCEKDYTALFYDGKEIDRVAPDIVGTIIKYPIKRPFIEGVELFGDNIFYKKGEQITESVGVTKWQVEYFFNSKVVMSYDTEDRQNLPVCVLSTNSILCSDGNKDLYLNSEKIGNTLREVKNYSYLGLKLNHNPFLFDKNVAWLDKNLNVKLRQSSNEVKDMGNIDISGEIYLFGNHLAIEKRDNSEVHVIYDGKDLGLGSGGSGVTLFGDHIAYGKSKMENNQLVEYITIDGSDIDVLKKLNLEKSGENPLPLSISVLRIFDNHFLFDMSLPTNDPNTMSSHIFYDWKDIGPGSVIEKNSIFGDHFAFQRDGHIIYDGKDLGLGSNVLLYKDHIGFEPKQTNSMFRHYYFDGQTYSTPNNVSTNLDACYKYYMENNVPTSPYGSISF